MKIKNYDLLAVTPVRKHLLKFIEAGLNAIDTAEVINRNVRCEGAKLAIGREVVELKPGGRLIICAVGKCAAAGALALEQILGDKIAGGVVLGLGNFLRLKKLELIYGTHPLPSARNIEGTRRLIESLRNLTERDAVIFLISGGGSTLLCNPRTGTCEAEVSIVKSLMKAGATIQELNTFRKHASEARGGYLARYAYPAAVYSLIFSDVPSDNLEFIASGPTVLDSTTVGGAREVLKKYKIRENFELVETPKESKYFERVRNILAVTNRTALFAMAGAALEAGYKSAIRTARLTGEAREVGRLVAREISAAPSKSVFLYGGETTVTVKNRGQGGRNMEVALGAISEISKWETLAAVASDGRDNSDLAGAVCDILAKEKAKSQNLDPQFYLDQNDSYNFFKKTGDFIETGDTGSNVSDLIIAIKE